MKVLALAAVAWALCGCASRQAARKDFAGSEERFWNGCVETAPAEDDGFQHFVCTDVKGRQWEVLVRRQLK